MMQHRSWFLIASALVAALLLGGGVALRVGAEESTYRQAVVFAEVLSLVVDNYVDPVDSEELLRGAYEGMLGGLDSNGAYLAPDEYAEWRSQPHDAAATPGLVLLKNRKTFRVASLEAASPAEDAGIKVGDLIRSIDGRLLRDLSLEQARRLLRGPVGTRVRLEVLQPSRGFERENLVLTRSARRARPYELTVSRGTALLRLEQLRGLDPQPLRDELEEVRSRGVDRLLLDLRNLAEGDARDAAEVARMFAEGTLFRLRARSGRVVETVDAATGRPLWPGPVDALVNDSTAGGAEALASLIRELGRGKVFGEKTYGLGAEAEAIPLASGAALIVSGAAWETATGATWNGRGVEPDVEVPRRGQDFAASSAEQLRRVLELLEQEGLALPEAA